MNAFRMSSHFRTTMPTAVNVLEVLWAKFTYGLVIIINYSGLKVTALTISGIINGVRVCGFSSDDPSLKGSSSLGETLDIASSSFWTTMASWRWKKCSWQNSHLGCNFGQQQQHQFRGQKMTSMPYCYLCPNRDGIPQVPGRQQLLYSLSQEPASGALTTNLIDPQKVAFTTRELPKVPPRCS